MGPNQILDKGMVATTAVPMYSAVIQTDVEHCALSGAAGDVAGIAQEEADADDATRGRVINIRVVGISRVVSGAALPLRARVVSNADGTVSPAAPAAGVTVNVVGIVVTPTGAAGEWGDVLLTPGATVTG